MFRDVTAFSVRIASPGDAAMELIVAREVIGGWNTRLSRLRKQILLPLGEEKTDDFPDLLVACFDAPRQSWDEEIRSGVGREIEAQLQAGKPAFLYFSEARMDFATACALRGQQMEDLKKRYAGRAVISSYGDEKEFRAMLARDLEKTVEEHPLFNGRISPSSQVPEAPELSGKARTLLSEACEDFEAYLSRIKVGGTFRIQANGKQLVEPGPTSAAQWEQAFQEILTGSYIRDAGGNGQLFQISPKGFAYLKSIGKTPGGYISEMGGM